MPLIKPIRGDVGLHRTHPLARGLVACWLMNGGSGNRLHDCVNPGRNILTAAGTPDWVSSNHGFSLQYDGSTEYHEANVAPPITAYPFSVVAWFYLTDLSLNRGLLWFGDKDATNIYQSLSVTAASPVGTVAVRSRNTVVYEANSSIAAALNTWNMAAGVWTSASLRAAYLNGGNRGTNTSSSTFSAAHDRTSIGRFGDSSPDTYWAGRIGFVGIWSRALTDAEVAWLYREPYAMFERPVIVMRAASGQVVGLAGTVAATSSETGTVRVRRGLIGSAGAVSTASCSLRVQCGVAGLAGGAAQVSGALSLWGQVPLSGTVGAVSQLSGMLVPGWDVLWFGGSLESDRFWLREALLNAATADAFELGTALTQGWFWVRRAGCAALYRGPSIGTIDFANVLAVVDVDAEQISPPAYIGHYASRTYFYVVRRFNGCGYREETLAAAAKVRIAADGNLAEAAPNNILAAAAQQVAGKRIRLAWFYWPLAQGSTPVCFKIYGDGGTGPIDFEDAIGAVAYRGRRLYSWESSALEEGEYRFAIAAEDMDAAAGCPLVLRAAVRDGVPGVACIVGARSM